MTTQALAVNFHGTDLFIVEHDGQPYTPMKTIAEGMGLDWRSQYAKLTARHGDNHHASKRWGVVKIAIPTARNMQQVVCLPLRKLAGWLATINPNKVKPELRDTIIQYQNECDDVLWDYWTKDQIHHHHLQPPLDDPENPEPLPDPFLTDNTYRVAAQQAINAHLNACHADMKQAGVTPPNWPPLNDKIITGLVASLLWRSRWLVSFDNDQRMKLQDISNDCIIDPDNVAQLKTFINEEVPVELMLEVINAASQKLARNLKSL